MQETPNYKLKKIDKEKDKVLASIDYLNFNFDKIDEELKNNKDLTESSATENKEYIEIKITEVNNTINEKSTEINQDISDLNNDLESHKIDTIKHITEDERTTWNNKSDFSGLYNDLKNIPEKFNPAEHNHDESYYKKEEIDEKGFITNAVDNLLNYYLKSETYTKEEVLELVNTLKRGLFNAVDFLPETGEPYIIYLIPSEDPEEKNIKDEYIWVNESWEKIGSTKIDLSGYATIEQMNQALQQKLNTTDIAEWAKQANKPMYDYSEIQNTPKEYQLPVASDTVLGGIKVGAGLEVDQDGRLNATGGGTADAVDWKNVQNKPETFTPSTHTHKQSDVEGLDTLIDNSKPIYIPNYTLQLTGWVSEDEKFKYVINSEKITSNCIVNLYLDLENQEKLSGGYTDSAEGLVNIYAKEKPEGNVVVNIEIQKATENIIE